MNYSEDNVFFKILQGELPAQTVFEDEDVLAFHDIYPKAPIHVLVVPKKLIATFGDLCEENDVFIGNFFKKVHKVAQTIGVGEGYKMTIHNGTNGGQEVFHIHAHILANATT